MPKKNALLHCHIFKNGGSTIDNILLNNFHDKVVFQEYPPGHFFPHQAIIEVFRRNNEANSLSSHRLALPVPINNEILFIPLLMIREPLDRLGSIYHFYQRQTKNISHLCVLAKHKTFKEFVYLLLKSGIDVSFANLQAQFVLGISGGTPCSKNWPMIIENFTGATCTGILDRFDETMVVWENKLTRHFPGIDFSCTPQNVSKHRHKSLNQRLTAIKEELGHELIKFFKSKNELDYELYRIANERLDREFDVLANKDQLLKKIQEKNIQKYEQKKTQSMVNIEKSIDLKTYTHINNISITSCTMTDHKTDDPLSILDHGKVVDVSVTIHSKKYIKNPIIGITIKNANAECIFTMNSFLSESNIADTEINETTTYIFTFKIPPLNSGTYSITPALASGTQEDHTMLCQIEDAVIFIVPILNPHNIPGYIYISDFCISEEKFKE